MEIKVHGNTLTIEVILSDPGQPSKSGKTTVIASTHGNKVIQTESGEVVVGLNIYRK